MPDRTQLMKVLVGSHAHGLARPDSDFDYRGVFAVPTREVLAVGKTPTQSAWSLGDNVDDTAYEVAHFLFLATKSNPSILEMFVAPTVGPQWMTLDGNRFRERLRALFPYVWSSRAVRDAHIGYGLNQRKKMLDNKDGRFEKYACAYLRALYNGVQILTEGDFTLDVSGTDIEGCLRAWRERRSSVFNSDCPLVLTPGEVVDITFAWTEALEEAYRRNPDKAVDLDPVNEYLWDLRKFLW